MAAEKKPEDLRKLCLELYGVYTLSIILQFFEDTILMGLLTLTLAYIIGNSKKKLAADTPYASHLRWMNRTFWIGSAVIVPIAALLFAGLVLAFTNIIPVAKGLIGDGDPDAIMGMLTGYLQNNMEKLSFMAIGTSIPAAAWWIRRYWVGFMQAKKGQPVEKVTSWL